MNLVIKLAFLLACAACCTGARPTAPQEQGMATDGLEFQSQGDRVSIRATRSAAGKDGVGTVVLHGVTLADAQRSPLGRVAAGRAWRVVELALTSDAHTRYDVLRRALDELGTHYRAKRDGKVMHDDTGQQVRLAEMAASQGDFETATTKLSEVLSERLDAYAHVFAGTLE